MHRRMFCAALPLLLAGCGRGKKKTAATLPGGARVLALGDSLTAGNGAGSGQDWPTQLAQRTGWSVHNAGISGETSAGALARLPGLLAQETWAAILIGIGGNDMLRSLPQEATRANITRIVQAARKHSTHVALIATPAPEPLRAAVGALKDAPMYADIAKGENVLLIDKVYAQVLSDAALRSDQVHANVQGYAQIAQQLAERLRAAGWRR